MFRITSLFCALLVGSASSGWWLGRRASPVDPAMVSSPSKKRSEAAGFQRGAGGKTEFELVVPGSPLADWMSRAEAAASTHFPELFKELTRIFPNDPGLDGKTMAATRWLFGVWVMKDADGAIRFAGAQEDPDMKAGLGEALARVDPAKALELLAGRRKDGTDWSMAQAIANQLAIEDPEAFLNLDPSRWGNEATVAAAFAALAKKDPAMTMALWESLRSTLEFPEKKCLYLMMDALVSGDSAAARNWVEKITDSGQRRTAAHAWLTALARNDPRAAWREMKDMDLGDFENSVSGEAIRVGIPSDFGDGRAAVVLSLAKLNRTEGLAALQELMASNPALGFDKRYLLRELVEATREHMVRYPEEPTTFLSSLRNSITGESDPDSREALELAFLREQLEGRSAGFALELAKRRAAEWSAGSDLSGGEPDQALVEMLDHVAASDPNALLEVMDKMPVRERQMVADGIWEHISLNDVEILGRTLPWQSAERWERLVDTYVHYLSSSPQKLQEMAPSFAALSGEVAVPAVTFYSQMWAQEDPITALNWASTLPPETLPAGVGGAVQSWMKSDDAAASEWANALPAGPVRDAAAAGLAKALGEYDLPSAMAWAGSISDRTAATAILQKMAGNIIRDKTEFTKLLPATLDRLGASLEQRQAVNAAMVPAPESGDPFAR